MDGGAGAGRRNVSSSFGSRAATSATQDGSAGNSGRPARPQPTGRPPVVGPQAVPLREPGCRRRHVGRRSRSRNRIGNRIKHHIYEQLLDLTEQRSASTSRTST